VAPGEYWRARGLVDLFPMGSALPYRSTSSTRRSNRSLFRRDTQRTLYKVAEIRLLPAREFPWTRPDATSSAAASATASRAIVEEPPSTKDVSNGVAPAGIEYYLPLFSSGPPTIFD